MEIEEGSTFSSEQIDGEDVNASGDLQNSDLNSKNDSQVFLCDKCSISFVSPVYLEAHKNRCRARMNETATKKSVEENTTLNSTTAGTKYQKKKSRIPAGELKYKCDTCGKGFVRLNNLDTHIATHNTAFKCEKCPYTTEHRRNLMRHIVIHFGDEDKKYSCPHCSYKAGKSSLLRMHVARHTNEKPYKCKECSYETAVLDSFNKHMTIHTGQKAFACSHCYYSTANKSQLAKHLLKFHSESGNST